MRRAQFHARRQSFAKRRALGVVWNILVCVFVVVRRRDVLGGDGDRGEPIQERAEEIRLIRGGARRHRLGEYVAQRRYAPDLKPGIGASQKREKHWEHPRVTNQPTGSPVG